MVASILIVCVIVSIIAISTVYMGYRIKYINDTVGKMKNTDQDYLHRLRAMNNSLVKGFETRDSASLVEANVLDTIQEMKDVTVAGIKRNQEQLYSEALKREDLERQTNRDLSRMDGALTYEEAQRKQGDKALFNLIVREESNRRYVVDDLVDRMDTMNGTAQYAFNTLRDSSMSNLSDVTSFANGRITRMVDEHGATMSMAKNEYAQAFTTLSNDLTSRYTTTAGAITGSLGALNDSYRTLGETVQGLGTKFSNNFAAWTGYAKANDTYRSELDTWRGGADTSFDNAFKIMSSNATRLRDVTTTMSNEILRLNSNDTTFSNQITAINSNLSNQLGTIANAMSTSDTKIQDALRVLQEDFITKKVENADRFSTNTLFVGPAPYTASATVTNTNTFSVVLPHVDQARMDVMTAQGRVLQSIRADGMVASTSNVTDSLSAQQITASRQVTLCNQACITGVHNTKSGSICMSNNKLSISGYTMGDRKHVRVDGNLVFGGQMLRSTPQGMMEVASTLNPATLGDLSVGTLMAEVIGSSNGTVQVPGGVRSSNVGATTMRAHSLWTSNADVKWGLRIVDDQWTDVPYKAQTMEARREADNRVYVNTVSPGWQVAFNNSNSTVNMNHGADGHGVHIRTYNSDPQKYGLRVESGAGKVFEVTNDGKVNAKQLCINGTCITPSMAQVLSTLT